MTFPRIICIYLYETIIMFLSYCPTSLMKKTMHFLDVLYIALLSYRCAIYSNIFSARDRHFSHAINVINQCPS